MIGQKRAWLEAVSDATSLDQEVEFALNELRRHRLLSKPRDCTKVIVGLGKRNLWRDALSVLQQAMDGGVSPDLIMLSSAVSACEKSSEWAASLALLRQVCNSAPRTNALVHPFNSAISACGKSKLWHVALDLLETIKDWGLNPSVVSYNATISACDRRRPDLAMTLLKEMEAHRVEPTVITFSAAISAAGRGHAWIWALALLDEAMGRCRMGVVPFSAAVSSCEKGEQWERALDLLRYMKTHGPSPNVITFNSVITACQRARHWNVSIQLFDEMLAGAARPSVASFNALIVASRPRQDFSWQWAVALMQQMRSLKLRPDMETFSATAQTCLEDAQWALALLVLGRMRASGVRGYSATYTQEISACQQGHCWAHALDLLSMMRADGLRHRENELTVAMNACGEARQWEVALSIFSSFEEHGVSASRLSVGAMAFHLHNAGRIEEAKVLMKDSMGTANTADRHQKWKNRTSTRGLRTLDSL